MRCNERPKDSTWRGTGACYLNALHAGNCFNGTYQWNRRVAAPADTTEDKDAAALKAEKEAGDGSQG